MDAMDRIDQALEAALAHAASSPCPPRLAAAMRYAVFPGGARIRPRLVLAVARACTDDRPPVTESAAAAIELLHCASLVHDDMPCFDDADTRRGKPSVHAAFGEDLALLVGDSLIVLAFETLARTGEIAAERAVALAGIVGRSVGAPSGIVAGQAWECESEVVLVDYHRAKTGALFASATESGAAAAGLDRMAAAPWRLLGERLGEAYQVADDLHDVLADAAEIGKPTGRDEALDRPSVVREMGIGGAASRLKQLVAEAVNSIPDCAGREPLRALIVEESKRFLPKEISQLAA